MVLPVMATWVFVQGSPRDSWPRRARFLLPHLAALGAYLVLRTVSLGGLAGDPNRGWGGGNDLPRRVAANLVAIPTYLGLLLFPRDLTIYHVLPEVTPARMVALAIAWGAVFASVGWIVRRGLRPRGSAWRGLSSGCCPSQTCSRYPPPRFSPSDTCTSRRSACGSWRRTRSARSGAGPPGGRCSRSGAPPSCSCSGRGRSFATATGATTCPWRVRRSRSSRGLPWPTTTSGWRCTRRETRPARSFTGRNRLASIASTGGPRSPSGSSPPIARISRAAEAHFRKASSMLVGPSEARLNLGKLMDLQGDAGAGPRRVGGRSPRRPGSRRRADPAWRARGLSGTPPGRGGAVPGGPEE